MRPRLNKALKAELTAEKKRCRRFVGHKSAEAIRYNVRSTVERVNARLKDEFGGQVVRVRGHAKVMCHLMFGLLALTANQMIILALKTTSLDYTMVILWIVRGSYNLIFTKTTK